MLWVLVRGPRSALRRSHSSSGMHRSLFWYHILICVVVLILLLSPNDLSNCLFFCQKCALRVVDFCLDWKIHRMYWTTESVCSTIHLDMYVFLVRFCALWKHVFRGLKVFSELANGGLWESVPTLLYSVLLIFVLMFVFAVIGVCMAASSYHRIEHFNDPFLKQIFQNVSGNIQRTSGWVFRICDHMATLASIFNLSKCLK